jgi:hypothetical protein
MQLIHVERSNTAMPVIFALLSSYEERSIPSNLGFTFDRILPKTWATNSVVIALGAIKYADKETLAYFYKQGLLRKDQFETYASQVQPPTRKDIAARIAAFLTHDEKIDILQALRSLAAVCDGARKEDMAGFNAQDTEYGHTLAACPVLSNMQAAYGKLMLRKYQRQIDPVLFERIWPENVAAEREKHAAKIVAQQEKADARAARAEDKETAKTIKKAAGRGKVSPEMALLLAKLGACDMKDFDSLVSDLRAAKIAALGLDLTANASESAEAPARQADAPQVKSAPADPIVEDDRQAVTVATETPNTGMPVSGAVNLEGWTPEAIESLKCCTRAQIEVSQEHNALPEELYKIWLAANQPAIVRERETLYDESEPSIDDGADTLTTSDDAPEFDIVSEMRKAMGY